MRVVTIPPSVEIDLKIVKEDRLLNIKDTVSFALFVEYLLDTYEQLAKTPKAIRQYDRIMTLVETANGKETVTFETQDFEVLESAIKASLRLLCSSAQFRLLGPGLTPPWEGWPTLG